MFETYVPKKFCREFVELKQNSLQLPQIMATVKGIKPCTDDWVSLRIYPRYEKICRAYGLLVKPDAVFRMVAGPVAAEVVGGERLLTTKAYGIPHRDARKTDAVHVFLAATPQALHEGVRHGWYPLIIKNRVIDKPLVDYYRFGRALGYPSCCVAAFRKYNHWYKYSYLYESFKKTRGRKGNFLCNPFLKNATYSYIYHMPCSYDCAATQKQVRSIRDAIASEEPQFVKRIDRHLKLPVLVFYERKNYVFEGQVKRSRIYYRKVYFPDHVAENDTHTAFLRKGDCVAVEGNDVLVSKKGKTIGRIRCGKKQFAPEYPFIMGWKQ